MELKIDCVSDMHGNFPTLTGGDLLIVAGDMTARDLQKEWNQFFEWIGRQQYRKKIYIGGNHDNMLQELGSDVMLYARDTVGLRPENAEYLCDSGTEFEYEEEIEEEHKFRGMISYKVKKKLKIWGSPWTSQFPGINPKCCAFTHEFMQSIKFRWDLIPDDVDILITHSPPYGILDQIPTNFGASAGDMDLLKALEDRIKPQLHVFGHIHENGGTQLIYKRPGYGTENNTICVNASIIDERYRKFNNGTRIILAGKSVSQEEESAKD